MNKEPDDIVVLKYINTFHLDGSHIHRPSDSMFYTENRTYRTTHNLIGVVRSNEKSSVFIFRKKTVYSTASEYDRQNVYVLLRRTSKSNYTMLELFECRRDIHREIYERV